LKISVFGRKATLLTHRQEQFEASQRDARTSCSEHNHWRSAHGGLGGTSYFMRRWKPIRRAPCRTPDSPLRQRR
jgi:hypothetical protein